MKLLINGEEHEVPRAYQEQLLLDLLEEGKRDYYEKVPNGWRVLAKPFTRGILAAIEKEAIKKGGIEAGRRVRPKRGDDPNLYLAELFGKILLEGLKYVNLTIDYDDTGAVSAFRLDLIHTGEAGGQVDSDRDIRLRQDDGAQIP